MASKETKFVTRTTADGKEVKIPVGIIKGDKPGKQITIVGGQHGTEYDGVTGVQQAFQAIDPKDVCGTINFALIMNFESFTNWIQFAPTLPEMWDIVRELCIGSEAIINCHGGELTEGMNPYVICRLMESKEAEEKAMMMTQAFGAKYVSFSKYHGEPPDTGGERPAWWLWPKKGLADELQIPEITPEIGQRGSRGENGLMFNGIMNVLRTMGYLPGEPVKHDKPKAIGDRYWLTAESDGIWFPCCEIDQDVKQGEKMGEVKDFFGNHIHDVLAPGDGKVMNMNWGMPVRKGGFVLWIGKIED